jgi:hypothetical protein
MHDPAVSEYTRLARVYDRCWSRCVAASVRKAIVRVPLRLGDCVLRPSQRRA